MVLSFVFINADGQFSILDVVLMQRWLLAVPDTIKTKTNEEVILYGFIPEIFIIF